MTTRIRTLLYVTGGLAFLLIYLSFFFLTVSIRSIRPLDGQFTAAFFQITRGTPVLVKGLNSSGRPALLTNFCHVLYAQEGLPQSKFRHDFLEFLTQRGMAGFGAPHLTKVYTQTNSQVLWIGCKSPAKLPFTQDYILKSERGSIIPLATLAYCHYTNQQHILTWAFSDSLTNGGKFELVDASSGRKLFSLTIPKK